jgi:hypothetical protein
MITLMVTCVHAALTLLLKFKKKSLWFDICTIIFWLPSRKYKIMLRKKKKLKTSKITSFSLGLYFIIAKDSLIYHGIVLKKNYWNRSVDGK